MRRTTCGVVGLCLVFAVAGGATKARATPEALAILKKSEAALAKVRRVRYRAAFQGTGWVADFVSKVKGTAVLGQPSKWDIVPFRAEVELTPKGSSETQSFTVGSDGDVYYLVDPKTKMAHEDMDPVVLGKHARDLQRIVMRAFVSPHPFGEKLESDKVELRGVEKLGGVECRKVVIKGDGTNGDPDVVWLIAKKDDLPRGIRRLYAPRRDSNGKPGMTELLVSDLQVNPALDKNSFKLVVPAGFRKTDEFAP